MLEKVLHHH